MTRNVLLDEPDNSDADPVDVSAKRQVIWTPPDALRILAVLGANLRLLILAPVVAVLAAFVYLSLTDPTYQIGAQLMLRPGIELAAPATASLQSNQQTATISTRLEDVNAEVQILKDPALIHDVAVTLGENFFFGEDPPVTLIQKLKRTVSHAVRNVKDTVRTGLVKIGLLPKLSKLDLIQLLLQSAIEINPVTRSDIIEISLSYPDGAAGEVVLNAFLKAYQAHRERIFSDTRAPDYFDQRLAVLSNDLALAEEDHRVARDRLQAWSVDDQRNIVVTRRETLVQMIADTSMELAALTTRIAAIDTQLGTLPERQQSSVADLANPMRSELALRRVDVQLKLETERRTSGSRTTQAQNLEEQLVLLGDMVAKEPARVTGEVISIANPLRESLVAQRANAEVEHKTLRERLTTLQTERLTVEARLSELDQASVGLARAEREIAQLRSSEDRFRRGRDDTRIAADLSNARISNLTVFAEPRAGIAPVRPRPMRILMIAAIGSLIFMAGLALLLDALMPRVRNEADLIKLTGGRLLVRALPEVRHPRTLPRQSGGT
ncbi:hypothetical protein [Pseudorhodobacter sp.]|uniref:hypothetical protein n=1 Tax=Pseudorhodobacter sp. TaxID=1934400 RepID=UPI002649778A|nr:hypothetical protein [Pseudorhodobacter sp.]MDN5785902.1 hypothetical protein [Pseudorhodobacter sp.]